MSCLTSSTGTTMSLRLTPLAAIFLALSVPAADAAVWRVTPADDVEDIVDNAEEGDTIIFAKGEYKVNLLLTEPLSLKGEDGAVINAGGKGSGITIRRSRTTVENLTIKNYGGDLYKRDSGVRVMDGCTGVKLTNLKLSVLVSASVPIDWTIWRFATAKSRATRAGISWIAVTGSFSTTSSTPNSSITRSRTFATVFTLKTPMRRRLSATISTTPNMVSIGCTPAMTSATTT